MSFLEASLQLTILMPCLNEAETLASCIQQARRSLERTGLSGEVLVADNGSLDGSLSIAQREGARVIEVAERGYGSALQCGIEAARGRWIVIGDADESYDFSQIDPFLAGLRGGADLVMGCRMPSGGGSIEADAMPWSHRWLGNPALSFLGRLFFDSGVHDFHCGMRAFSRDAIARLDLRTTGMEFASEMVIKAVIGGLRIEEVPVTLRRDGRSRAPHLRSWRDGWRHLRFMLLFSPRWLFLVPGLLLVVLGAVVGLRLWLGPIRIGRVNFDTNTLLVCALALIVGVQLCVFAIFARVFTATEGLLPFGERYVKLFRVFTLERGLAAGFLSIVVGLALLVRGFLFWKTAGFGGISYPESLRMIIPAVTACAVGAQIVFSSFLLSVLGLRRR
jgi:glycosyltransferase involved in cell wall biosynthesis